MSFRDEKAGNDRLRKRTVYEALAWAVLIAFLWTVDTLAKISYRSNTGYGPDNFRLVVEQATSACAVLVMVLFVTYWLRLFPVRRESWMPALLGHVVGSILFAFGHHVLMILQRAVVFALYGETYLWQPNFVANLIVEYQKDVKIYLGMVAVMSAYQYYRRMQSRPDHRSDAANRLVVQTGSGEAVLNFDDIDYVEASRNYVAVHAGAREYLLRDTFANVEKRLAAGPFVRIHRSYIVSLDKVAEIRSVDDAQQVQLKSGASLPLGRSYRDGFKSAISAA